MNKHMIVTSFALVLTMTVVLAVGKTGGTAVLNMSASAATASAAPGPDIRSDVSEEILIHDVSAPIQNLASAAILSEVDEGEMILGQEIMAGISATQGSISPLFESLARVQNALTRLEQVAASTEQIVVALENKAAAQ